MLKKEVSQNQMNNAEREDQSGLNEIKTASTTPSSDVSAPTTLITTSHDISSSTVTNKINIINNTNINITNNSNNSNNSYHQHHHHHNSQNYNHQYHQSYHHPYLTTDQRRMQQNYYLNEYTENNVPYYRYSDAAMNDVKIFRPKESSNKTR